MTTPHCPWCNTSGIKNVQAATVAVGVLVLYCGQCGAIFGIAQAAATPQKRVKEGEKSPVKAVQPAPKPAPVVVKGPPEGGPSPEHVAAMSPLFSRGGSLYRVMRQLDDDVGENT